ncbi:hypothetical protein Rsph17029_0542 [Rhodobacter sphaeroides ATCC 17029]|nr:hypothetical protein Rsph17029_0542 [Cereibacter sphaeroides ATCC 17029]
MTPAAPLERAQVSQTGSVSGCTVRSREDRGRKAPSLRLRHPRPTATPFAHVTAACSAAGGKAAVRASDQIHPQGLDLGPGVLHPRPDPP